MTVVYVANRHVEYEGFDILGIYYFKIDAENRIRQDLRDREQDVPEPLKLEGRWNEDGYSIDEHEVK